MLALTAPGMNAVNAVILDRMQSEIPLIPALAGHLISGGGKRLRPMLTLAGAELVGYQGSRHYKLAASVEFIHTATLLHDDVVDGSEMRRGPTAANMPISHSPVTPSAAVAPMTGPIAARAFSLPTRGTRGAAMSGVHARRTARV